MVDVIGWCEVQQSVIRSYRSWLALQLLRIKTNSLKFQKYQTCWMVRIWNHQRHLYFDRHISSISSRATSRFKFERDWRYLFIQIKMTKERRCSLHWLRGCSTRMYRSFPKNNSKKIRYLTLYLNTNSQSTSWYTQPPTSSALLAWIQAPDMFGYKNI